MRKNENNEHVAHPQENDTTQKIIDFAYSCINRSDLIASRYRKIVINVFIWKPLNYYICHIATIKGGQIVFGDKFTQSFLSLLHFDS